MQNAANLCSKGFVSLRRIERYLISQEIAHVTAMEDLADIPIAFNNATISWPQTRFSGSTPSSTTPSAAPTPKKRFTIVDLTAHFPKKALSLICGRLGSGKTLLLLGKFCSLVCLHSLSQNLSQ